MSSAQFHPALTAAAQAVVTDNRPAIQQNIEQFLSEHADHVDGLLLRAWTANSLDSTYYCIQRVLELDPENATAKSAMSWMQGIWTLAHQQIEIDRLEQERLEQERFEQEKLEQERLEQERQAHEEHLRQQQLEQQRREQERLEQERLEQERLEQERQERERLEQELLNQQRLEQERLEQERLEQERLEQERLEQERLQQAEEQKRRFEQQLLEQTRLQQEQHDLQDFQALESDDRTAVESHTTEDNLVPMTETNGVETSASDLPEIVETTATELRLFQSDEESNANSSMGIGENGTNSEPKEKAPAASEAENFWAQMPQINVPEIADDSTTQTPPQADALDEENELQDFVTSLSEEVKDEIAAGEDVRELADINLQKPTNPHSGDIQNSIKKPLILAVDDSPTIRKLVSITLAENGYEVVTAPDGVEALKLLAERLPDLILLDINMPRLSGYKLCNFFKKHERTANIPVIMLSGNDGVIDKMRGKIKGCDAFIGKPFATAELVAAVSQHLQCSTS